MSVHCSTCTTLSDCTAEETCRNYDALITRAKVLDLSSPADALRLAVHAFATELRERLRDLDVGKRYMLVSISLDMKGEPEISFALSDLYKSHSEVKGANPADVIEEFKRRRSWQLGQDTKLISPPSPVQALRDTPDDDIPF